MVLAWDSVHNTYTLVSPRNLPPPVVLSGASPDDMVLVPPPKGVLLQSEFPHVDLSGTGGWPETAAFSDIVKKNLKRTRHDGGSHDD